MASDVASVGTRRALAILASGFVLLIGSCRTLPEAPYPNLLDRIPEESQMVLRLDVRENPGLTDLLAARLGIDPERFSKVRDRTSLVVIGIEMPESDSEDRVPGLHVIALGDWPRALMGSALGSQWTKSNGGKRRWDGPDGLELAVMSREELILSSGRIDEIAMLPVRTAAGPADITESPERSADLYALLSEPAALLGSASIVGRTDSNGNPMVRTLEVQLRRTGDSSYDVRVRLIPSDARMVNALALALRFGLSARFGLSPNPDERNLMSAMSIDTGSGAVGISIAAVPLDLLDGLLTDFAPLPEVQF